MKKIATLVKMSKKLAVFDFDHTIVDDNSDIVVRKLLKNDQIPESTKVLYKTRNWTIYMGEIFKLLHKYKISKEAVKNAIINIPPVENIPQLIRAMVDKYNFDVIIISDSNSLFINDWLISKQLNNYIKGVFTNPADYNENNLLKVQMYHEQKDCSLSQINLCKGKIMEEFIENQANLNINYEQTVYVGDGKNDFCPILRLKENDIACVRNGYACVNLVKSAIADQSEYKIHAKVCIWKNGKDILKVLEENKSSDD